MIFGLYFFGFLPELIAVFCEKYQQGELDCVYSHHFTVFVNEKLSRISLTIQVLIIIIIINLEGCKLTGQIIDCFLEIINLSPINFRV
jgi:hypothetical protein